MKNSAQYLLNFLMSFLLAIVVTVLILSLVMVPSVTSKSTYTRVVERYDLAEKAYSQIQTHFSDRSGATNIPASVYDGAVSVDQIEVLFPAYVESVFDYTFQNTEEVSSSEIDFTKLEENLSAFFEEYAKENNIQRDDAFEAQYERTLTQAKEDIISFIDISFLERAARMVRPYAPSLKTYGTVLIVGSFMLCAALAIALLWKGRPHGIYWIGVSLLCTAALLILSFGTARVFGLFDGFILANITLYSLVTGFLKILADRVLIVAGLVLLLAIILLLLFGRRISVKK